jgi:type II secretory pathway pseudopilin PulG
MRSGDQRGFSYLLLLLLLAVLAVATTGSLALGHVMERRAAEEALLAAGEEFRLALLSWRRGGGTGPAELSELLRDPRVPGVRRHLRQLPFDPMTGRAEWGLLRDTQGRIVAVYSLAEGEPIKRDNFDALRQAGFEDADSYTRWTFGVRPVVRAASAPPPIR